MRALGSEAVGVFSSACTIVANVPDGLKFRSANSGSKPVICNGGLGFTLLASESAVWTGVGLCALLALICNYHQQ